MLVNLPATGGPMGPVGIPMIGVRGGPMDMDIPPRVKDVSIAFFVMLAAVIIGLPLVRAIARRIERGTPRKSPCRRRCRRRYSI